MKISSSPLSGEDYYVTAAVHADNGENSREKCVCGSSGPQILILDGGAGDDVPWCRAKRCPPVKRHSPASYHRLN